jgi:hypothetical protein
LFIPLTLSTLSHTQTKEKQGEGKERRLEAAITSKEPWTSSRSWSPQEVGVRRGRIPLSLTISELGGCGACKKKEHKETRVGASQQSLAALGEFESSSRNIFMDHIAILLEKTTNDLDDDCTLCKFI